MYNLKKTCRCGQGSKPGNQLDCKPCPPCFCLRQWPRLCYTAEPQVVSGWINPESMTIRDCIALFVPLVTPPKEPGSRYDSLALVFPNDWIESDLNVTRPDRPSRYSSGRNPRLRLACDGPGPRLSSLGLPAASVGLSRDITFWRFLDLQWTLSFLGAFAIDSERNGCQAICIKAAWHRLDP